VNRPTWRARLAAAVAFVDHLLLQADTLIAACLDVRPLHRSLFLVWLSRTWCEHLDRAHVRRHGPGRGVLSITINPRTEEEGPRD
jgi:hypothetical protein